MMDAFDWGALSHDWKIALEIWALVIPIAAVYILTRGKL